MLTFIKFLQLNSNVPLIILFVFESGLVHCEIDALPYIEFISIKISIILNLLVILWAIVISIAMFA